MCHHLFTFRKILVIKVSLFHPVKKKKFGFDPALYVIRVWLLITPPEERLPRRKTAKKKDVCKMCVSK